MRAAPIALASWLLPSVAVLITYLVSSAQGQVPTCMPFFEGCTSISGAARRDPSIHIFRTLMLPTATIMAAYWLLARAWLGHLGDTSRAREWMMALGLVGALFMVLYVVFLGTEGRAYGLMRRYGVMVYFAFTAIAQLVLVVRLNRLPAARRASVGRGVVGVKIAFCVVMLALGIVNVPASYYFEVWEVQNVIAWHFALLMHGFFGLTAISWWRADYRVVTVIERA